MAVQVQVKHSDLEGDRLDFFGRESCEFFEGVLARQLLQLADDCFLALLRRHAPHFLTTRFSKRLRFSRFPSNYMVPASEIDFTIGKIVDVPNYR